MTDININIKTGTDEEAKITINTNDVPKTHSTTKKKRDDAPA